MNVQATVMCILAQIVYTGLGREGNTTVKPVLNGKPV
jgi:hypothetical protein